ncbi:MAG: serine/threonine-protein kinase [Planctomycetota bacterium]
MNFFCNPAVFFFQEEVNETKFGDLFMNTSEKDKCKRCGAVIPSKSTEKLCPACLMSGALAQTGGKGKTVSMVPAESLPLYGPSEFPCEFGGYRLLGLLGRGGMGTVYEAEQLATGRRVALKMLGQQLDSPDMRKRFLREGRLAAGVNHPNSLYIFGSEEIEDLPVITMEIAGSGTLKDKLKKHGPLPVTEAVDAILDVISGLEAAFARGVLHRDVKPSNCFISPDGSVKVGDFGLSVSTLARTDTFITAHGKIMGTPAYASPEQLRGDALDLRADIYSVGATLFTLLTDRAPFEGENAVQVVANAVNQKPKPLTDLRQDTPPGLERVVARCLAKEPDGRYADYTALRNALLPFSSKEPEPASMDIRGSAGWIDFLIAFLVPYGLAFLRTLPLLGQILHCTLELRFSLLHYRRGDLGCRSRQVPQGCARCPHKRPAAGLRTGPDKNTDSHWHD